HLEIRSEIEPDAWVLADADLIKQVVQNLTGNAVKYNQDGGFVSLGLRAGEGAVQFTIANSGPGIPPGSRAKIFTRFFRGDQARSRKVAGVGLGLSLAREIVRAHHGELRLDDAQPGITAFTMTLPRAEP
ncbi:MAG: ATP-binding protein, partial [Candidatus Hydrogenedentes bacterium]|nr:ATP-binding protein [Candidatus Hydrogenedentota bacterium]